MKLVATGAIEIEDGVHPAMLTSIEEREPGEASATQEPYLRWTFSVKTEDGTTDLIANSSQRFGPKSKARAWFQAALGREIVAGEEIDPAEILPLPCQVVVKTDSESGYARIQDVLKAKKQQRKPTNNDSAASDDSVPF